jgi:hypothetical protein
MISGTTNNINGVWGSSDSNVFAVGNGGTILHYDGAAWSAKASPTVNNLNSIWGSLPTHVFAVGDNGTILHYDGTTWSTQASPVTNKLNSVWGFSDLYAYAVGDDGALLFYNGTWTSPMPPGTFTVNLNAVWGLSGSDVFVVGDGGTIAHFGGSPPGGFMDSGTTQNLYDVWGGSGADVFAVGANGTILHYSALLDDSCEGRCGGQAPAGCYCDEECHSAGNCCPNKCEFCYSPLCGQCQININPSFVNVPILGLVQFNATVDGTCNAPCFTWEISLQESTGSTINQSGLYTAGGNAGTDIVQVADPCNENIANAAIVYVGATTTIPPTTTTTIPAPSNDNLKELLLYYAALYSHPQMPVPLYDKKVVAKAEPDECFNGIGTPYPPGPPCYEGQPKVNQAYVWGLTKSENVWLGTAPNPLCLVIGGILQAQSVPIEAPTFVCEFGESQLVPPLTSLLGDWRPPGIYEYNQTTQDIEDRTLLAAPLINKTLGLRSAGSLNDVVFLAGPNLGGGINMFSFRSDGTFLGGKTFGEYSNIRKWIAVEGVLYTAVGNTAGGGSVLRWIGNAGDPFQFANVGILDNEGSNIAFHEGRLFTTTWPAKVGGSPAMGLYMSPAVPPGGLTVADANNWIKVWKATDYEPDTLVVRTYGGGDLSSFDGTLFWGTMHVPFLATQVALNVAAQGLINLDPAGDGLGADDLLTTALGTHRAVNIFAGKNFGTPEQHIELLYGDQYLPVYDATAKSYTIACDTAHQNRMPNPIAKYGPSGIGNFFNAYTWTMETGFKTTPGFTGLLVGTFDWSYILEQMLVTLIMQQFGQNSVTAGMILDSDIIKDFMDQLPAPGFGADLFVAKSAHERFILESNDGQGNYLNYGIRTMLPTQEETPNDFCPQALDQDVFYLGMANPMNLATDPNKPQGGWELIKLSAPAQECGTNIVFDIKPSSLNLKCQGVMPAEVSGTDEFNVTNINTDSLRLTREGIDYGVAPVSFNITDGTTPSHADMLLKLRVPEVVETLQLNELAGQTIPLVLTGQTFDGTPIRGQDFVLLLGNIDRDCHADFDCDADVDGSDALTFKHNFGRSRVVNPCSDENVCDGDFDRDSDVDGNDAFTFKAAFGTVLRWTR